MGGMQVDARTRAGELVFSQVPHVSHVAKPEMAVFCSAIHVSLELSNTRASSVQSTPLGASVVRSGKLLLGKMPSSKPELNWIWSPFCWRRARENAVRKSNGAE